MPLRVSQLLVLVVVGSFAFCQPHSLGAAEPPPVSNFIAVVRGHDATAVRRTFPAYKAGLFARVFGAGEPIALQGDAQRALFTTKLVRTPAGVTIDVGHVVTGLEAAQPLPPSAEAVQSLSGCSLRADVTWAGDAGQALIDFITNGESDPALYFDREASPDQLLGDLDGYTLGALNAGPRIDVGTGLESAYLRGDYEASRFGAFLQQLGSDYRAVASREIVCYATAFARFAGIAVDAGRVQEAAPYFSGRFLDFVERGAASEAVVSFAHHVSSLLRRG
jgi:hypothetical protein